LILAKDRVTHRVSAAVLTVLSQILTKPTYFRCILAYSECFVTAVFDLHTFSVCWRYGLRDMPECHIFYLHLLFLCIRVPQPT